MKSFSVLVIAATAATSVMSAAVSNPLAQRNTGSVQGFTIANSVMNSAAFEQFQKAGVVSTVNLKARQEAEPDPNRNETNPDLIFLLQCTDAGFRGDCLVFGSSPGDCVSYFDYQPANSTVISDAFNDKVTSLSTNTGGKCQFYKFKGCDNKGDDRGLTSSYNYNLAVALPDDPRTVEYDNQITSWRC
ncbi:uncharacterized protein ColSpa_11402 [Colletotrichum spaethianum]|uniref:Secreted protein n=1 Tax=Colletotrichum spaethianum TaxID=700344 RepID=A0AA37PF97_9PEZI|nr:uncharacterized protein ColSpa_11402 [Colletotrichum spaethianum]GKT51221.1 hypothetical protein ColSpa_11402 [Colletotrichum spaethianum]